MYSVCGRKDVTSWSSFIDVTVSKWISIRWLILSIRKRVVQQSPTACPQCVCGKLNIGSDSLFKITEPSKNVTSVRTSFQQKLRKIRNSH